MWSVKTSGLWWCPVYYWNVGTNSVVFQDTWTLTAMFFTAIWVVLKLRDYNIAVYMYRESNPLLSGEISLPISPQVVISFAHHLHQVRPYGWEPRTYSCQGRFSIQANQTGRKITIIFHQGNISRRCLNKNISREAYNTIQCQALHASLWYWLLFGMQQLVLPLIHSHKPRVRSICFPNILTTFREQLPLLSSVQRNTSLDV